MTRTAAVAEPEIVPQTKRPRALLAGMAVVAFASLLLELALTRLFSVVLFYHFAFLAISIALLGLGAGGVFASIRRRWLARWELRRLGAWLCVFNAAAIVIVLAIVLRVPVSLEMTGANFLKLTLLYVAAAVPFFFTGVLFSVVFARETGDIAQLYAADLGGAALACLLVVPLLNWTGGPNTILLAAVVMAAGAVVWADTRRGRRMGYWLAGGLLLLVALNSVWPLLDVVYAKGMFRDKAWVEFARWNAISRVEVNRTNGARYIVIDADASSAIMNVDPYAGRGAGWKRDLMAGVPAVANVLRPRGDFAIIGPGGGVDVLRAVANGSQNVVGIEINPIIVDDIMRGRYAEYAHHLYSLPEVTVHVTDGRSWIRQTGQRFDVIQMTLVDTWASTAAGAFALSENNLYTVEAFHEYFQHLKPDGFLAVTRWEFARPREALRVVSVAMEALRRLGAADPAAHFIVVSDGALDEDGRPVAVLAKRSPFTAGEEAAVQQHIAEHENLAPIYFPSAPGSGAFAELLSGGDPYEFARRYAFNVAPVTDDAPFFFFNLKTGQALRGLWRGTGTGIDWKVNMGVAVLAMLLVISVLAVAAFLIVPLAAHAGVRPGQAVPLLYFVAVGLGYIVVEIAFIQRFVLFLGHPIYALTVVVFLMLLASGAGSYFSRRWLAQPLRVSLPLAGIVAALLAYVLLLPGLLHALVGASMPLKMVVSAAVLAPLAFVMGMPFPSGLRALALRARPGGDNTIEWAWAMNAGASVLGAVLAMVIAMHWGINATLLSGAAAYLAAVLLLPSLRPLPA